MQFKKMLLATFALMSAIVWAPQAQAIPAFARQTGMACSACHFQHFPTLNSFGRSFKASGFTMVGAEGVIEGNGLSLPTVLNLAFITNLAYTQTNGPDPAPGTGANSPRYNNTTNQGQYQMTQYSLFMGGRVAENIGFEGEVGLSGGAALASVKMPFTFDAGGGKLGIVPFTTDGLGPQQGFEPLSDGATPVHLFNQQDLSAIGATEYMMNNGASGGAIPASGAALYYYTDQGFVNFTKWSLDSINGNGPGQSPGANSGRSLTSNYLRAAWTPNVAGFDSAIGFQLVSGVSTTTSSTFTDSSGLPYGTYKTKMAEVDGQMLGDVGGMPLTLIASYAIAPGSDLNSNNLSGGENVYNMGNGTRRSFNVGAELGVLPKTTVQIGLRRADSGLYVPGTTSGNATDNAIMVGATYSIALNVRAELTYSKYSGDMYNNAAIQSGGSLGSSMATANLWMGF